MRWILAVSCVGLAAQAALVYAILFFRQAAHDAPGFWNGGYAVLWSLWAARYWIAASAIQRQEDSDAPSNPVKGSVLFTTLSPFGTSFSYFMPRQLPDGNPGAAAFFLIFTCFTLSLSLACAWYKKRRQPRSAGPRPDAS